MQRRPHTHAASARAAAHCCASVWDSCWSRHWTQSVTQRPERFRRTGHVYLSREFKRLLSGSRDNDIMLFTSRGGVTVFAAWWLNEIDCLFSKYKSQLTSSVSTLHICGDYSKHYQCSRSLCHTHTHTSFSGDPCYSCGRKRSIFCGKHLGLRLESAKSDWTANENHWLAFWTRVRCQLVSQSAQMQILCCCFGSQHRLNALDWMALL